MTQLLLLGTNHFDRDGGNKIKSALRNFAPDHILVEGSRESHEVNLEARKVALEVINQLSASDGLEVLIIFERDGQLRDITAVDGYKSETPAVEVDFFRDEPVQNIRAVSTHARLATQSVIQQVGRLNRQARKQLIKEQLAKITANLAEAKKAWSRHGDRSTEPSFANTIRQGDTALIDQRDRTMWAVLKTLAGRLPNDSKIATVTGAAHIARTNRGVSLLDMAEASGRFEITRDMLWAR
ncbi:MAG: hypothetical protein UV80_C0002G0050 [Candidatus Peregrinibacteria bacterium GW2011_GWF2_43_17]|nr:MAG: hypothetical protein UV80_C0002G0050 [Candidatus Peregrinibacteria bacterium GW2011_GWF2_43_17]KKT20578.1 MAG: hypothetical protein UW03_C0002G0044 [Candidatus Peregrinibacteria bacterium GW2011_GWA2_43_8]HAU39903.1 hypothetical protein [Candidatus Peregrinibacteria bacterium]